MRLISRLNSWLYITLYPVLFPANLVLTLAAANLALLTDLEILVTITLICLVSGMLFLLIAIGLKDWQRSGFLIFVWTIWGGYFGVIVNALRTRTGWEMNLGQQITVLVLWTGFFLLLCNDWVWQKVQKPQTMTYFFNVFSLVLISSSVYRILAYRYGQIDVGKYSSEFGELRDLRIKEKPDIYYIVLDGYGRADVLKDIYALDIDAF